MNEEPAPRLSIVEYMTAARFDKAPAAPESFDATAAVRRVLALADELADNHDSLIGASVVARGIRRAVKGET